MAAAAVALTCEQDTTSVDLHVRFMCGGAPNQPESSLFELGGQTTTQRCKPNTTHHDT